MNLLIMLIVGALVGSLQSVGFVGRIVTLGDFIFFLIIPLVIYLANRQVTLGRNVLGATELSMGALLALLPVTAYMARSLGDGTFLNGYRSLGFAAFAYVSGRLIATERTKLVWTCLALYAGMGYVLYQTGQSVASFRYGQDVTHLVGYKAEGLGNNISNLNLLGMLWCGLACLAVYLVSVRPRGTGIGTLALGLVMLALVAPGVVKSFSRSAYIFFAVVLAGFYYVLIRGRRNLVAVAAPIVATSLIASLVVSIVSGLTNASLDRVSSKLSGFTHELGYRLDELLLGPISSFFGAAQDAALFIGVYNSPQHSSVSHYFVMFGLFGLFAYLVFQYNLIADGVRTAARMDSQATGQRALATFSTLLAIFLLLNDLVTNLLFYNPTFCYLAYFLLGLGRPYLNRDGR